MRPLLFAANWKMHHGPAAATDFLQAFLASWPGATDGREIWFFPPALTVETVRRGLAGRAGFAVGVQNVYWEPKGAFTGELSVPMVAEAGVGSVLVGHSERRHGFGETDEMCRRKVAAVLDGGLTAVLCVGETLDQRDRGETLAVVRRQLDVLGGLDPASAARVIVAYEPVWAIGTGKNATPEDAEEVHAAIREYLGTVGIDGPRTRILYGGSVKPVNAQALVSRQNIDGVLVGGASLDPVQWLAITQVPG